ncbi:MAG: hypothetical protein WBO36_17310, partial [Saprospiraceae bacterium]
MKKCIKIIVILLMEINVYTQPTNKFTNDISVPSPEAASLGKYADIPINLANGTGSASIPIGGIKSGPLGIDVSLNYHLGGLRLSEMASWVGLGWSLSAGGMISRTVLGTHDDYHSYGQGYYFSGHTLLHPYNTVHTNDLPDPSDYTHVKNQVRAASTTYMDSEPDIFNFNFGGYSGKFVFRINSPTDKQIVQLTKSDVKIALLNLDVNHNFVRFQITTPDGTKYIFGSTDDTAIEKTNVTLANQIYNTSWYLTEIKSSDDKYTIKLSYTSEGWLTTSSNPTQTVYPYISGLATYCGDTNPNNLPTSSFQYSSNILDNVYSGWRLNKIYSELDTIVLVANTTREDLANAKRLDEIRIKTASTDQANPFCKVFQLSYDYMVSAGSATDNRKKRLRLLSVAEKSCDNSLTVPPYTLEYHSGVLPERLSLERDHWGYYNGSGTTNGSSNFGGIPPNPIYESSVNPGYYDLWATGNRTTDENSAKIGTLQKIHYPMGGRREIDIESNDYSKTTCNTSN